MSLQAIETIARGEIGVTEVPGGFNNTRIVEYHATTSIGASDDSVPWCSSFMNWVVEQAGYAGTGSPAARSWLKWGKAIDTPVEGCIVVLSRGTKSWQGHVGVYVGETAEKVRLISGNSSDQVRISDYPKSKVLGFRVPKRATDSKTVKTSTIGAVIAAAGASVQAFPEETIAKAGLISRVFGGWSEHLATGVAVTLVILAFVYIVRERLKKLDERQV